MIVFSVAIFLLVFSIILSMVIERVTQLSYKWYLILKVVSDGIMFLSLSLMIVSYGLFLYENVKF